MKWKPLSPYIIIFSVSDTEYSDTGLEANSEPLAPGP